MIVMLLKKQQRGTMLYVLPLSVRNVLLSTLALQFRKTTVYKCTIPTYYDNQNKTLSTHQLSLVKCYLFQFCPYYPSPNYHPFNRVTGCVIVCVSVLVSVPKDQANCLTASHRSLGKVYNYFGGGYQHPPQRNRQK